MGKISVDLAKSLNNCYGELEWHEMKRLSNDRNNALYRDLCIIQLARQVYDTAAAGRTKLIYSIPMLIGSTESGDFNRYLQMALEAASEFNAVSDFDFENGRRDIIITW